MHLFFRVDQMAVCSTLEAVLACARRGGIELSALHASRAPRTVEVRLQVHADDDDALRLFVLRLGCIIDVLDLQTVTPVVQVNAEQLALT